MKVIGLTGGIGSGKTTVSDLFSELGIQVVDADVISRQLTAKGGKALPYIREQFGDLAFTSDGSLNRDYLRQLVFQHPQKKKKLESILHPMIKQVALKQLQSSQSAYQILSVPLMRAGSFWAAVSGRILLVDCPEELQVKRVITRSRLSREQVLSIIQSQPSRSERISFADDVIENVLSKELLRERVLFLHKQYLKSQIERY